MGKTKQPIMTLEEERFMAFEGLLQWTQAVVTQSVRVTAARGSTKRRSSQPRSADTTTSNP